jgi:hypothetical protein
MLRPITIVNSRPRRRGSAMNGPAKIAGPPLTLRPAPETRRSQNAALAGVQRLVCPKKKPKPREKTLAIVGIVRDGRVVRYTRAGEKMIAWTRERWRG